MAADSEIRSEQKKKQMNDMAMAMYRSGDFLTAQKIWLRLNEQDPDYPGIGEWLDRVNLALKKRAGDRPKPDPSVFRTQRDLLANLGQSPRRQIFRPKTSHVQLEKGIRHRHIVGIFAVAFLAILLLSIRNNRTYLLQLNQRTSRLECYQGNFFPVGWKKTLDLEIGIESDWIKYVENRAIIRKLEQGVRVRSVKAFDHSIIDIFMTLGDESLRQMTERGQQSAIYYFKRVADAASEIDVTDRIVRAFVNLSLIKIASRDFESAQRYLNSAREYNAADPGIALVQRDLTLAKKSTGPTL